MRWCELVVAAVMIYGGGDDDGIDSNDNVYTAVMLCCAPEL